MTQKQKPEPRAKSFVGTLAELSIIGQFVILAFLGGYVLAVYNNMAELDAASQTAANTTLKAQRPASPGTVTPEAAKSGGDSSGEIVMPEPSPEKLSTSSISQEDLSDLDARRREHFARLIHLPPGRSAKRKGKGKPVLVEKRKLLGTPFYIATVDLTDPDAFVGILLANGASRANCAGFSSGDEDFRSFVSRANAAVVMNGTFFSKDQEKRVMGNMVSGGKTLKYSQWENYGTTVGITAGNVLEMQTARLEGQPDWSKHWFSLTCGPRLVKNGVAQVDAKAEGFADSHVLSVGPRVAIGYPASKDKLYLVTFINGLSLEQEARLMKAIGCSEAMNLDGGASRAFAVGKDVKVSPSRPLTNVLVVYDSAHPAPAALSQSWRKFEYSP